MIRGVLRYQHVYLKLGIFTLGVLTGIDVSIRQLILQSSLFLVFMLAEIQVFKNLLFGLRKLLPFITAYWVFALLFSVPFMQSVLFTGQLLYFVIVMVAVWARVDKSLLISHIHWCTKFRAGKAMISFVLSTYMFFQLYISKYQQQPKAENVQSIINQAIATGREVHAAAPDVAQRIEALLSDTDTSYPLYGRQNILGMLFLTCLGLVHNL